MKRMATNEKLRSMMKLLGVDECAMHMCFEDQELEELRKKYKESKMDFMNRLKDKNIID